MKAKKLRPKMEISSVNGEQQEKRHRRRSVCPRDPRKGPQKRKCCKGEVSEVPADEMMPVAPNRFVMGSDGAAAIEELDRKCNDLAEAFMQRIRDFNYVPHEQLSLEEKRAERRRYLEVQRHLRAS